MEFIAQYARSHSGGLAVGWISKLVKVHNSWSFQYGIGIDIFQEDQDKSSTIINIYGPYEYRFNY